MAKVTLEPGTHVYGKKPQVLKLKQPFYKNIHTISWILNVILITYILWK